MQIGLDHNGRGTSRYAAAVNVCWMQVVRCACSLVSPFSGSAGQASQSGVSSKANEGTNHQVCGTESPKRVGADMQLLASWCPNADMRVAQGLAKQGRVRPGAAPFFLPHPLLALGPSLAPLPLRPLLLRPLRMLRCRMLWRSCWRARKSWRTSSRRWQQHKRGKQSQQHKSLSEPSIVGGAWSPAVGCWLCGACTSCCAAQCWPPRPGDSFVNPTALHIACSASVACIKPLLQ